MPEPPLQKQAERTPEGHFAKGFSGNPAGRQPGSRNHATRIAEMLLDGEADALTRKAVALALGGDALALRLCLDRVIAPRRDRPVHFDLPPIADIADVAKAMAAITAAVAEGAITPSEGAAVARVVDAHVRAVEASDFDRRLKALEAAHAADL